MKKAIKITDSNKDVIESLLKQINGRSVTHVYSSFKDVESIVSHAEKQLASLRLPKKMYKDAKYTSVSGDSVASAYKYGRNATEIVIVRKSAAWYVEKVRSVNVFASGGNDRLYLTEKQDIEVVKKVRQLYNV